MIRRLVCISLLTVLFACGGSGNNSSETTPPVKNEIISPEKLIALHSDLEEVVAHSMSTSGYFSENNWHQHFGDAYMYGPAYDLAEWKLTDNEAHYSRACAVLDNNLKLVENDSSDIYGSLIQAGPTAMALLGLIEAGQFIDDSRYAEASETLLEKVDALSMLFDDYIEPQFGEFVENSYGPTSLSAIVALVHLEQAFSYPERNREKHINRADKVLDSIHDKVWFEDNSAYRFAPRDERLTLYPNALMMLAYGRAYQMTKNPKYLERIESIFEGIQPLKDEKGDHYHSPYSAEMMGALDHDYTTLSSQNYLMMALWMAYLASNNLHYLDEIDKILGFIKENLVVDGVIVHHWINGRAATVNDPVTFCSGCNLQTIYILNVIEQHVVAQTMGSAIAPSQQH